jgi:hypothetical protein
MSPENIHQIRDLVRAVCESHMASGLKQLLEYFANNWIQQRLPSGQQKSNERQIGIDFYKLSKDWDSHETTVVRTSISRLKQALQNYFRYTAEGRAHKYQLLISNKPYLLRLAPNKLDLAADERFWDAHAMNGAENLIIHTEPLWFWDPQQRAFIRYLDINADSLEESEIRNKIPPNHPARLMTPCFQYQSAGEIQATGKLENWLRKNSLDYEIKLSRDVALEAVLRDEYNLIILGSSRSNGFIKVLQQDFPISLGNSDITVRTSSGLSHYTDDEISAASGTRQHVYVIVTRRTSLDEERAVTIVAGNHGRGVEKAAELLTTASSLQNILHAIGIPNDSPVPPVLQFLLQIRIVNYRPAHGEPIVIAYATDNKAVQLRGGSAHR